MQETKYDFEGQEKRMMEFFTGKKIQELTEEMDNRLSELKQQGHTLVRRIELDEPTIKSISRNAPCPCGSGHKYKRCCMKVR